MKKNVIFILLVMTLGLLLIGCGDGENVAGIEEFDSTEYVGHSENTERTEKSKNENDSDSLYTAEAGDIVYFGHYEQDNNIANGKEKIAWRVLETEMVSQGTYKQVCLLSEFVLDIQSYKKLNNWLFDDFLNNAFTTDEQILIFRDSLYRYGNEISLLTKKEVKKFFSSSAECRGIPTEYAKAQAKVKGLSDIGWWLNESYVDGIDGMWRGDIEFIMGSGYRMGTLYEVVNHASPESNNGVRPMIFVDLKVE